jgi:anthranilate synthase component 1
MEIIDDLEREPRGVYGGGVGYYSWAGDADFAIVIRTATVEHGVPVDAGGSDSTALTADAPVDVVTVQAGAGIVADSVPEREYDETEQKMGGVLAALEAIEVDASDAENADDTGERTDGDGPRPAETEQEASR